MIIIMIIIYSKNVKSEVNLKLNMRREKHKRKFLPIKRGRKKQNFWLSNLMLI